jgi:hypothetical protein
MSNANSPIKVLKAAHKRVSKNWTKGTWRKKEQDGSYSVCLEGAIYGFCRAKNATPAQKEAIEVVESVIIDHFPHLIPDFFNEEHKDGVIPLFNDGDDTTKDDILEAIKLGMIRLETEELEKQLVDEVEAMDL